MNGGYLRLSPTSFAVTQTLTRGLLRGRAELGFGYLNERKFSRMQSGECWVLQRVCIGQSPHPKFRLARREREAKKFAGVRESKAGGLHKGRGKKKKPGERSMV